MKRHIRTTVFNLAFVVLVLNSCSDQAIPPETQEVQESETSSYQGSDEGAVPDSPEEPAALAIPPETQERQLVSGPPETQEGQFVSPSKLLTERKDAGELQPVGGVKVENREILGKQPKSIIIAVIETALLKPAIAGLTYDNPAGSSAAGALVQDSADVVIGSGFLASFDPLSPLGLLIVNGELVNEIRPNGFSTVLGVEEGRLWLVNKDDYEPERFSSALQTGPRLVEDGVLGNSPEEPRLRPPAKRAFVGFCEQDIIVGVSLDPIHLHDLAAFLASPKTDGGLGCQDAVNLAGGGSEALVVRTQKDGAPLMWGNVRMRQASLLTFTRR